MNLIAAVDRNWAIGNKGQLLVRIPNDHKMFRQETLDKVVVYGRKTLETFPLAQPLDRRVNIILSTNPNLEVRHAQVVHSIEELLEACREYPSEDIYIIGGASVYRQLLPYCDTAHITKIDYAYEADACVLVISICFAKLSTIRISSGLRTASSGSFCSA